MVDEYLDSSSRANRLASVHEGFLCNMELGLEDIVLEDLLIYLRWYISHLHSLRKFNQFMKVNISIHNTGFWHAMQNLCFHIKLYSVAFNNGNSFIGHLITAL